jgi:hypothetical protein
MNEKKNSHLIKMSIIKISYQNVSKNLCNKKKKNFFLLLYILISLIERNIFKISDYYIHSR